MIGGYRSKRRRLMLSNRELRARAREQLGGNIFATAWLWMLLMCLIFSAIYGAASYTVAGVIVLAGPLEYGFVKVLLDKARGTEKPAMGKLFSGFSENFGASLVLGLMVMVFTCLWSLLFVIPGIIKAYSYSMAFYIRNDNNTKDWKQCIDESKQMMNGNKWKLFCLDLSFIGWYILGALCFGVGTLFVEPYHMQARTNFYLSLKGEIS